MTTPQAGIFVEDTAHHTYQQYKLGSGTSALEQGKAVLALVLALEQAGANTVVGLSKALCEQIGVEPPVGFRDFESIGHNNQRATATQSDLFVWLHGPDRGELFDAARIAVATLAGIGSPITEHYGFVYRDSRDLTGFIDGTENPSAQEGRQLAVCRAEQPGAGGSVLLVQRWIHDLDKFESCNQADQEAIIGRTKPDSIELDEAAMPATSHVARMVMEDEDGVEIEIYRRSAPFVAGNEAGLMFVGFSDELAKLDNMVRSMYGLQPDEGLPDERGEYDHLIDYSVAASNAYFFTPCMEELAELGHRG